MQQATLQATANFSFSAGHSHSGSGLKSHTTPSHQDIVLHGESVTQHIQSPRVGYQHEWSLKQTTQSGRVFSPHNWSPTPPIWSLLSASSPTIPPWQHTDLAVSTWTSGPLDLCTSFRSPSMQFPQWLNVIHSSFQSTYVVSLLIHSLWCQTLPFFRPASPPINQCCVGTEL